MITSKVKEKEKNIKTVITFCQMQKEKQSPQVTRNLPERKKKRFLTLINYSKKHRTNTFFVTLLLYGIQSSIDLKYSDNWVEQNWRYTWN